MDRQRRLLRIAAAVVAAGLVLVAVPAQAQDDPATYTLQVEDMAGVEPGASFTSTLKFRYDGATAPEHGVQLTFTSGRYLTTTADYANCGEGFCAFEDFAPEPGVVYELTAPLTTTLAEDAVEKAFANDFTIGDLPAEAADGPEPDDVDTVLAFEPSDDQAIEHHPYMLVTVADAAYDIAVADHTIEGAPGDVFTADLTYANLGPAGAVAYENPETGGRNFTMAITLPAGLEVVHQGPGIPPGVFDIDMDNYCLIYPDYQYPPPDASLYGLDRIDLLCFGPGILDPGEAALLPIDFRITEDAVSNDGAISMLEQSRIWEETPPEHLGTALPEYPDFESDPADNTAALHLDVTGAAPGPGGPELPETGDDLTAIGLAGAGTIVAGALLLALLRRRTLRNL